MVVFYLTWATHKRCLLSLTPISVWWIAITLEKKFLVKQKRVRQNAYRLTLSGARNTWFLRRKVCSYVLPDSWWFLSNTVSLANSCNSPLPFCLMQYDMISKSLTYGVVFIFKRGILYCWLRSLPELICPALKPAAWLAQRTAYCLFETRETKWIRHSSGKNKTHIRSADKQWWILS